MIFGTHVVLNSTNAEADRAFLQDVLGLDSVDAGRGWLVFALPPAEIAVHPASQIERPESNAPSVSPPPDLINSLCLMASRTGPR
jgi:hypothetical protein